ncbi:MAG TPA: hypothetical protein VFC00_34545 [Micromonosporaceae bacterium]|nr:hypothetical protein [Micromonosporaceae bacterium]
MKWVTAKAVIKCAHDGTVQNIPSQHWVTVEQVEVLVENDPEGRDITACPNYGPTIKPCVKTLKVAKGYSLRVRIDNKPVVLDTLDGLTDGTPPGVVHYTCRDPADKFVEADQ